MQSDDTEYDKESNQTNFKLEYKLAIALCDFATRQWFITLIWKISLIACHFFKHNIWTKINHVLLKRFLTIKSKESVRKDKDQKRRN